MRTLFLALLLCAVPAMAQPDFVQKNAPRPTDVAGQIKQDLQRLKQNFSSNNDGFPSSAAVYQARPGFFGATEWMRGLANLLNGNSVQIDAVKVLERDGDTARAAVVYSFHPAPNNPNGERMIPPDPHQEIMQFKLAATPYEGPMHLIWQIVPPTAAPAPIQSQTDLAEKDDLFANVAYHLAQKQPLTQLGTPAERSLYNLKILGLCVAQLSIDYDEVYAFEPRYLIEAITPYVGDPTVFQVPDTNEIYTFNANLSGKNLTVVKDFARTVLFYEGQNEKPIFRYDGKAAIGFADGHAELVTPEEAQKLIWRP